MSDDLRGGAPSFGDLFDDPDSEAAPAAVPATPQAAPVEPAAAQPVAVEPAAPAYADDLVVGHDLDHESAEASHLVAGFEHDEPVDDPAVDEQAPVAAAAAAGAVSVAAATWDGTPDPASSSAPAGRVDTGRLYRSAGAEGPATLDAIPALDPDRLAALEAARTATAEKPAKAAKPSASPRPARGATVGLTYSGVMVITIAATTLVGFVDAVIRSELGWLTGLALLVSSVYCAVFVRRADSWGAVVAPPLAFLVATLTAGQLTLGGTGGLIEREAFMIFKSLAVNAPWIIATTVICLVIVVVRRRREPAAI